MIWMATANIRQLVDLMHGEITLDSGLGIGTKATFTIPFNKPQFRNGTSPLIDIGSIPERLQSELSVSGCASDDHGSSTPPQSPLDFAGVALNRPHRASSHRLQTPLLGTPADQETPLSDIDRKNIHVLVVEDKYVLPIDMHCILLTLRSAINQQIALKTIKKYGFSVSAVWNGREALDYLVAAPAPGKPKPDIILMDVQMPVLDGYRATHLIRTHNPYSSIDGMSAVPIVAMTASAIQGDQEKCRKAGMDDYLAKPVKGKTLENMLVKWALKSKRKARLEANRASWETSHDSSCSVPEIITASTQRAAFNSSDSTPTTTTQSSEEQSGAAADDPGRAIADSSALPGPESEAERGMQRVEAEEKATSLRDDKLLAASTSHIDHTNSGTIALDTRSRSDINPPTAALTEENMGRLDREHDLQRETVDEDGEGAGSDSSLRVGGRDSSPPTSTVGSLKSPNPGTWHSRGVRGGGRGGKLRRNESDRSQKTVTQLTLQE